MAQLKIQIFPKYDPCCGETTCGCGDDPQLESFLSLIKSTAGNNVTVELFGYSTKEKLNQATAELMPYLEELKFEDRKVDTMDILRYITPAVVINKKLRSKKSFPGKDELREIV